VQDDLLVLKLTLTSTVTKDSSEVRAFLWPLPASPSLCLAADGGRPRSTSTDPLCVEEEGRRSSTFSDAPVEA